MFARNCCWLTHPVSASAAMIAINVIDFTMVTSFSFGFVEREK
jgi:hypothetical protein